jgi:hypothetical protein
VRRQTFVLVAVTLLAAACARGGSGSGSDLQVIPLEGDVFLLEGSERTILEEPKEIDLGTVVGTGGSGRALLKLPLGQSVELAPNTKLRLVGPDETELMGGRILTGAPEGLSVTAGAAQIQGAGGFFRLDRYVGAMRLGVYSGSATVHGWDGRVGALEQIGVAAGIVPEAPVPLRVDPSDRWDVRRLGSAIRVGLSLEDLQRGLGAELQTATAETIARLLPRGLPPEGASRHLQRVSRSEALVAAMVAMQAARRDGLPSLDALRDVVRLRELGASWIVVVATWQLYTDAILNALSRITDLIARTLIPVVATSGSDSAATGTGGAGAGDTGSQTDTGTDSNTGGGGGGGGDGGGGGGGDDGGGGDTCSSEVDCAVQDVIDEVGGGVGDGLGLG